MCKNKELIVSGDEGGYLNIWSALNYKIVRIMKKHKAIINSVKIHRNDRLIFSASSDWSIKICRISSGLLVKILNRNRKLKGTFESILLFHDCKYIVSVGIATAKKIAIWSLKK